jgi:CubicO group peptidase (beta-lactamase class C family)
MRNFRKMDRRKFLSVSSYATMGIILGCSNSKDYLDIDEYILTKMVKDKIPGLSVCIIKSNDIIWQKSYGYENIEKK